ncbi:MULTISPECIES: helix-turn-helix domain-containing protein [Rhodophyticola]|uniref:helix-turn-helix domain-containing protein n=1 Tax=Rhodophyticola TaxID=2680018 RepID=UPI001B220E61|nr:helix-turn-helix domain-containing protein [Roseicyclus sp.]MBO6623809.1 helix-turn-helix domain-containing protein [Roseicyclus sp.]MBO6922232.1 helix-turn-helix domain-containing protein [Roseicyclus sp.]
MLSKPFMTTQEIAKLLKVREQTVRSWIHLRDLRAVKLGREFRVAVKDLEAFVNEHATRAPSWTDGTGSRTS